MANLDLFDISVVQDGVSVVFSSTLQNVDQACEVICQNLTKGRDDIHRHLFSIQLVLREGLTNAVRHGNAMDRKKRVRCSVKVKEDFVLQVEIEDQGEGFDWRTEQSREPCENEDHGRGLAIMERYFTRYSYNEVGNKLILEKHVR